MLCKGQHKHNENFIEIKPLTFFSTAWNKNILQLYNQKCDVVPKHRHISIIITYGI